jgi:hypothetical protein
VLGVMPITAQQVRRGPQALCAFAEVPGELAVPRRARPGGREATFVTRSVAVRNARQVQVSGRSCRDCLRHGRCGSSRDERGGTAAPGPGRGAVVVGRAGAAVPGADVVGEELVSASAVPAMAQTASRKVPNVSAIRIRNTSPRLRAPSSCGGACAVRHASRSSRGCIEFWV